MSASIPWLDEQLFSLLTNRAVPGSKAISSIKSVEDLSGTRGAKALFRIAHDCKGHCGELRMETLRDAVREPKPCQTYAEVLSRVTEWEMATRKFEK